MNGTLTAAGNASSNKANGLYNAGGTVTVNGTLTASGGQYSVYNYGTLNLSGTVNANKNVYLGKDRTITVVGELDNATSITVQTSATPAAGSPRDHRHHGKRQLDQGGQLRQLDPQQVCRQPHRRGQDRCAAGP